MNLNLSLGPKMALFSAAVVTVCLGTAITFTAQQSSKQILELSLKDAQDIAQIYSGEVQMELEHAMQVAKGLRDSFQALRESGVRNREAHNAVLKQTMITNPELAGTWAGFEPNAFDGRDSDFKGFKPHNIETGRYVSYFYNFGSGIEPYYLTGYDDPTSATSAFYFTPLNSQKPHVVDPVMYDIDGTDILLPSFAYPLVEDGKSVGVIGVDMAVNDMAASFAKHTPLGTGRVSVLSYQKTWVAHPDTSKIGQKLDANDSVVQEALQSLSSSDSVIREVGDHYEIFVSAQIKDVDTPWTVIVSIPTATLTEKAETMVNTLMAIGVLLVLILSGAIWIIAKRIISTPLTQSINAIKTMQEGVYDQEIKDTDRADEIGSINAALEQFRGNTQRMHQLEQEQKETMAQASRQRAVEREKMANDLESSLGRAISHINTVADGMKTDAESMAGSANSSSQMASSVARNAQAAADNSNTVAAATEELSSSITEISSQVQTSSEIAQNAVSESERANHRVTNLMQSAERIGEVVNLINNIASQTNLLALNATIEAARAGEAGKGFAVVAHEVKNLANQTAQATDEIAQQITSIQDETQGTVEAIQSVSSTISSIHELTTTIAAAIEEQGAATQEISSNVQQAAQETNEVTNTISSVKDSAESTGTQAQSLQGTIDDMGTSIQTLDNEVRGFLNNIRNTKID